MLGATKCNSINQSMLNWTKKGRSLITSVVVAIASLTGNSTRVNSLPEPTKLAQGGTNTINVFLTAEPGSNINLRSGPGLEFAVLNRAEVGQTVTTFELQQPQEATWYRVRVDASGAQGWVRSDLLVWGIDEIPSSCHRALASARGQINGLRNVSLESTQFAPAHPSAPDQRPQEILFFFTGTGKSNIFVSPQFTLAISTEMIRACNSASTVRFVADFPTPHDVDGLMNGKVRHFQCVDHDAATQLEWGDAICDHRGYLPS